MANCYCCKQSKKKLMPNTRMLRYNQDNIFGRFMELFQITNPFYLFYLPSKFRTARSIINKIEVDGIRPMRISDKEIWKAKTLYDSIYNPTGQKAQILARPIYYAPLKTLIFYGMLVFHKDPKHLVIFQILNQAFNTNIVINQKNPRAQPTTPQVITSFLAGSLASSATAVHLHSNRYFQCHRASKLMLKLVPFFAVAAGHCASIPFIRAQEMHEGKPIYDCCGTKLGVSKNVAHKSVTLDVINKIFRVAPPLLITPFAIHWMQQNGTFCRYPYLQHPAPLGVLFVSLVLFSPMIGAFFRQRRYIAFKWLDPKLKCKCLKCTHDGNPPTCLCYCAGPPLPF